MNKFVKYIIIFLISMVPIVELRGAIPIALDVYHLKLIPSFIICIIGNMIPVPFIYLFARKVLEWGKDKRIIGKFCTWCLTKGERAGNKLQKSIGSNGTFIALLLFVGIPIPGTGAWTGTLAASFLDLKFRDTVIAVVCGVLLAGIIMAIFSYGLLGVIS